MSDEQPQKEQQQEALDERIVSLKIKIPETEDRLEIPCSVEDTIFDIVETLKILPSTREYTAYELKIGSKTCTEETFISELIEDNQDSISISLIPSPYTEITARKHVINARLVAGLDSLDDSISEISGLSFGASTYDKLELSETVPAKEEADEESGDKKVDKFTVTDEEKTELSTLVSEIIQLKSDDDIISATPAIKPSPALKSLFISQWSPANISNKLNGDLFYLQVQTLEGEVFNITSHVGGFFVNNCSNTTFNGFVHSFKTNRISMNYSLISLLKSLSPMFEQQIEKNDLELSKHAIETYIVPTTTTISSPWLVKKAQSLTPDLGKSQYNLLHGGIDGFDLQKDWNKDYQLLKDIPRENLTQRYSREQSLISTSSEFTTAAIKGAMAIVRGEIEPVNPEEDSSYHIYLRNGIFYSNAIDSIGQFNSTGGDEAARSSVGKDITALKYLNKYDINGIHSLLTTVVDYAGRRIVCQAPVPGIFQNNEVLDENEEIVDSEQTVKYGFIDDHSDVVSDEKFCQKFKEVGEAFHLKPHKVWNNDGTKIVDVVTSGYTKGTKGNDDKTYIIDMFRTTPLDIEFIDEHYDTSKDDSYPHRETLLRHEAIGEWIKRETAFAVKKETERLEAAGKSVDGTKETIGVDRSLFLLNPDAFSLSTAPTAELAKELKEDEDKVREVSKFVSQVLVPEFIKEMEKSQAYNAIDGTHLSAILHENGINIRYLGKIAKLAAERKVSYLKEQEESAVEISKINEEVLAEEEKELAAKQSRIDARIQARKEAAEKGEPIPDFKEEEEEEQKLEKEKAEQELEANINTIPIPALLDSLYKISVIEMVARATKHFLRKQVTGVPLPIVPYIISHVHNCLLASKANPTPESPKLNILLAGIYKDVDLSILDADSKSVLDLIAKEVFIRYRFKLSENWIESIKPTQLMKSIATKFGIQWKKRDFAFTAEELDAQVAKQTVEFEAANKAEEKHYKKKGKKSSPSLPLSTSESTTVLSTTFAPEDIICIVPISKNSIFESTSVPDAWETGAIKLGSKDEAEIQEGSIFVNQAVQFCERLYGPVHNITATYLTKLGNLYAASNDSVDSVLLFKKAFQIFERTSGIDSFQAALSLDQLASALLAGNKIVDSIKIYKRLLNYWILSFDEYHPNVLNILTSVGVILMRLNMTSEAIKVFSKTLELSDKISGKNSQQSAFFRYQLSQLLLADQKFKESLELAEQSFEAFKLTLGLKDKSTAESRKLVVGLKNYNEYMKYKAKSQQEQEQEARKLEQQQHIKSKQAQKTKKVASNPAIANQSVDDIVAFISGSGSEKKQKKNNKKKNSKK